MPPGEFVKLFGGVYDSSWWVAEAAAGERPFMDFAHFVMVMKEVVEAAGEEQRRVAIGAHGEPGQAHREAKRRLGELVGSELQITLGLPAWIDDVLADAPTYFRSDEERMAFVIGLSRSNVLEGTGGPFGAAVFECSSGRLMAPGVNVVVGGHSSVAHAEAMAFMLAQQDVGSFDLGAEGLPAMEVVTSSQPCIQCYGMTWWSGVRRLVIGARAADVERITGFQEGPLPDRWVERLEERQAPLRPVEVRRDVLADEACSVLELYHESGGFVYNAGSS